MSTDVRSLLMRLSRCLSENCVFIVRDISWLLTINIRKTNFSLTHATGLYRQSDGYTKYNQSVKCCSDWRPLTVCTLFCTRLSPQRAAVSKSLTCICIGSVRIVE